ncbi:MAG: hypothetical protein NO117_02035 [Sulfolobales archaeon]|nr:hypothetical protein [Sulfolobales archaeon]
MKAHVITYTYTEKVLVPGVYAIAVTQEKDEESDLDQEKLESYTVKDRITRIIVGSDEYVNGVPAAKPFVSPLRIVAVYVPKEAMKQEVIQPQTSGTTSQEQVQEPVKSEPEKKAQEEIAEEVLSRIEEKKPVLEKIDFSNQELIAYGLDVNPQELQYPFVIIELGDGRSITVTRSEFSGEKAVRVSPLKEKSKTKKKRSKSKKSKKSSESDARKAKKRSRKSKAKSASA